MEKTNHKPYLLMLACLFMLSNTSHAQVQKRGVVKSRPVHKQVKAKIPSKPPTKDKKTKGNKHTGATIGKDVLKAVPYLKKHDPDTTQLPYAPVEPAHTFIEKVMDASKIKK